MSNTSLSPLGLPRSAQGTIANKTPANYPEFGLLVEEFDIWHQDYQGAVVNVYLAGTTTRQQLYSDPGMTVEIDNPQVLLTRTEADGTQYGKFESHVYVPYAYELDIDATEQTGVQRVPLTDLVGKDASDALVTITGSTTARKLKDIVGATILLENYGQVTDAPSTNTTLLNAAISAAAAQGGGTVILPAGTIPFTTISLPEDVQLQGQGIDTTILESESASKVITVTGDNAGLSFLTLDGVALNSGSYGLYGEARNDILLEHVRVKRFDKGIEWQGGDNHIYKRLYVDDCSRGFAGLSQTAEFTGMDWFQGKVSNTTVSGVELQVVDQELANNHIRQVDFDSNAGADGALLLVGARYAQFDNCRWTNNTIDIWVQDNPTESLSFRETTGLYFTGGEINAGTVTLDGLCQDVIFDSMNLDSVTFAANIPDSQIVLRNCVETDTTFSGDTTKISRWRTSDNGAVKGLTTDGTVTTVYKTKVEPGENVSVLVHATAERQNASSGHAQWLVINGAKNAPATLLYDDQTANFTVGNEIVGATSGARAVICADSDSGTTGTLSLCTIDGEFVDNEVITEDGGTGSARVNGSLVLGTLSLAGTATSLHAIGSNVGAPPAGWDVTFAVLGQELLVKVTGAAANTVAWNLVINVSRL